MLIMTDHGLFYFIEIIWLWFGLIDINYLCNNAFMLSTIIATMNGIAVDVNQTPVTEAGKLFLL